MREPEPPLSVHERSLAAALARALIAEVRAEQGAERERAQAERLERERQAVARTETCVT